MNGSYPVIRAILCIMSVYHLIVGIALNCPVDWVRWVAVNWFAITRPPEDATIYIVRMLGVYMLAFGVALAAAAWNPVKNRTILTIGAALALLRAVQRLVATAGLERDLGIPRLYNYTMLGFMGAFAITLLIFRWRIYQQMKSGAAVS